MSCCGPPRSTGPDWRPAHSPELAGLDQDGWTAAPRAAGRERAAPAGDSLEFRHGLLREAVYDDLLPDERTRLHAELAAILQARVDADTGPGPVGAEPAGIPRVGRARSARALVTSVRAGRVALKVGAAEAVTHLERALVAVGQRARRRGAGGPNPDRAHRRAGQAVLTRVTTSAGTA